MLSAGRWCRSVMVSGSYLIFSTINSAWTLFSSGSTSPLEEEEVTQVISGRWRLRLCRPGWQTWDKNKHPWFHPVAPSCSVPVSETWPRKTRVRRTWGNRRPLLLTWTCFDIRTSCVSSLTLSSAFTVRGISITHLDQNEAELKRRQILLKPFQSFHSTKSSYCLGHEHFKNNSYGFSRCH